MRVTILSGAENSTKEVLYTKEKQASNLIVKEPAQQNEATDLLKSSWAMEVSRGCMINNLSSRVPDFKGVEVVMSEDRVYKS